MNPRILTTTIALLLTPFIARAVLETWDGNSPNAGAGDSNLSTALNWADDSAPLSDLVNTDLIFAGLTKLTPNVSSAFSANSIGFTNTAGAFTLGGAGLTLGTGGIANSDTQTQTINNSVTLGAATSVFQAINGGLTFGGAVSLGANALTLSGANAFTLLGPLNGTGTLTKNSTGALTLTPSATPIAADLVLNAGTTTLSATGTTQVFSSASSLAVNGTSVLNLNENVTLDGGQLTRTTGAALNLAAGKFLTLQNGADATVTGLFNYGTASTILVNGVGSSLRSPSGTMSLNGGSAIFAQTGGLISAGLGLNVGSGGNGAMTVDGIGSNLTALGSITVGLNGGSGSLSFSNVSTGTLPQISIPSGTTAGTVGAMSIQSGASVTASGIVSVGAGAGAVGGTLTINGSGSLLAVSGLNPFIVGAATASTATVNVQNGGAFTNGGGPITVNATGTVALTGGTFHSVGDMTVSGQFTRDAAGVFDLSAGRTLTLSGGGDFVNTATYSQTTASTVTVTGAGSSLAVNGAGNQLRFHGGSTLNVLAGAQATSADAMLFGFDAGAGNATLLVSGAGSQLTSGAGVNFAANGNSVSATFSSGATASFPGAMNLAFSLAAGTNATMSILSGATVLANSVEIASANGGNAIASLTVDGAGSLLNAGSGLTLGAPSATGAATLTVQNGGTVTGASLATVVRNTGVVAVNGGTFSPLGDLAIQGGQFSRNATGIFTLAAGKKILVESGSATITGALPLTAAGNSFTVTGASSTLAVSGAVTTGTGFTLRAENGGAISLGSLNMGAGATAGSLTVTGPGSTLAISGSTLLAKVTATFESGASSSLGDFSFEPGQAGATSVFTLNVQNGSHLTAGAVTLGTFNGGSANGAVLALSGPGSSFTQTGAATLRIGQSVLASSSGSLVVTGSAAYTSGTGTVFLEPSGLIQIDGGSVTLAGPLQRDGGLLVFTAGALSIVDNFTVGLGGLLGSNVTLDGSRRLATSATTTINGGQTLTLNGGTFTTAALVNNGTLAFNSGTLAITGAGGFTIGTGAALGASVVLGTGANLQVTNTATIAAGASVTVNGGSFTAGALANSGTLRASSGTASAASGTNSSGGRIFIADTLNVSGTLVNASGGRITLEGGSGLLSGAGTLSNSGVITGDGTITKTLANTATGDVRGEAGRTLIFLNAGAFNSGQMTLLGGTLDFSGTLTNSATGFISGHGALFTGSLTNSGTLAFSGGIADVRGDVANNAGARIVTSSAGAVTTFYDDVIHNGAEIRTSAGGSTVFFGAVSGAGPYTGTGTVYFEGDLRPGNSPASVLYEGDLVLGGSATLTLELGGLLLGGQYDHLNVGGTFTADGALDVVLYNGFAPHFGDTFDLFDAGALAGNFDAITLPALSGDLAWDDSQLSTNGQLRVVPEPGIGVLLASALSLLGLRRRRTLECGGKRQRDTAFGKSPGRDRSAPHPQSIPKAAWR